ncbi:hypothetical protein [Pleurocapsa sp. PCC 7319]|uniref:hypothetical protein n=1 Tax=Pleurocapsa sp. PCC 7319 TaxID=118161 RepID=UPI00034A4258|nr:hypothetical protein [Pleurocapsa sp. PCC 7319]
MRAIPGKISIEKSNEYKISRCIYYFDPSFNLYCLLRIFEFQSKTIVIASQLNGAILWDNYLIKYVMEDFELNHENILYWINHIGLFDNCIPVKEKFLHTTFSYKKDLIFSQKTVDLKEENEINIESVENLIESSLEPVEFWLGLDPKANNDFKRKREEKIIKLLHLYLQDNLKYLSEHEKTIKVVSQSLPGAIFFYPHPDKYIEFIEYSEIETSNDKLTKKALKYINKSFPDRDLVICVCIKDYAPFCIILPKEDFINRIEISFDSLKKSIYYELEMSNITKLNFIEHQEQEKLEKVRIQSLLEFYLKPNLAYLISRFEKDKLFFESELETVRGALFYYPKHNYCEFSPLKEFINNSEKSAIPYINKYNVKTEVVICVCFDDEQSICSIFPK